MRSFRNDQNFENFDSFIGQIILYLSTNQSRERLTFDYNSVFSGSEIPRIRATYFDKTYVLNANASIYLKLSNTETKSNSEMPMLFKGSNYEADLSGLLPGTYTFTVSVRDQGLTKSGSFTIVDFDVEKQLISTDYKKLERLARNTGGNSYFPAQIEALINDLEQNSRFLPVQKGEQNIVSLIDFRILLVLIASALSAEWFIRKYKGLI